MPNYYSLIKFFCFIALCTSLFSCSSDDSEAVTTTTSNSIYDFISSNDQYSTLEAAIVQIGLEPTLMEEGNFTLFAPTNTAFDAFLGNQSIEEVDNDVLVQLLFNHILSDEILAENLTTGYVSSLAQETTTDRNISLFINTANGVSINNQSMVIDPNIVADNGVIHSVDTVIEIPTLNTLIASNPDLSLTLEALTINGNTEFTDLLSSTNDLITTFAPNNGAVEEFLNGASLSNIDPDVLNRLVTYNILTDVLGDSQSLENGYLDSNVYFNDDPNQPINMYINTDGGNITINGISEVVSSDIIGSNGVLHIINSVNTLPNVTTFVTADPNFISLATALTTDPSFGFIDTLETQTGSAPFTVFAPENMAFTNLLGDLGLETLDQIDIPTLEATLGLHVITDQNIRSEQLTDTTINTLGGQAITLQAAPAAVIDPDMGVNTIINADIQALNGVIHVLDRVIRDL